MYFFSNQTFNLLVLQSDNVFVFKKFCLCWRFALARRRNRSCSLPSNSQEPGMEFRSSILNLSRFGSVRACNFNRHFFLTWRCCQLRQSNMFEFTSVDRKLGLVWFEAIIEAKYISLSISYESRLSTCLVGNNSSRIRDSYSGHVVLSIMVWV